jgi:AAA domain
MKKTKQESEPREDGSRMADVTTDPMQELWKKYGLQVVDDKMDLPPINWIVDGLIEEKSPTTIIALPKVGKTFVQLSLALVIVLGGTFFGREVTTTGRVIYFCGEGHCTQVMKRVDGLLKQMGKTRADLKGRLLISDKAWHMGDMRARGEQIGPTDAQEDILAIVKTFRPTAIFIDPLTRFTRGENEDKSYEMSPITNFIQHKLCPLAAVIVGHHTDKKGNSARGTGDILGFVATELFLDGNPGTNRFTVHTVMRNAEAPEPFVVKLDLRSVEVNGAKTLDTVEVVVHGAKNDRNSPEVRDARSVLLANQGIGKEALAKALKVRRDRAAELAALAGADWRKPEGKGKAGWYLPLDEQILGEEGFQDVDAGAARRAKLNLVPPA